MALKLLFILILLLSVGCESLIHNQTKNTKKVQQENSGSDIQEVLDTLKKLSLHIQNKKVLSAKEIEQHIEFIKTNKMKVELNETILKERMNLIAIYDKNMGPLWIKYKGLNHKKRQPDDEIHWAIFWVMQSIFDEVYNAKGLKKYMSIVDGYRFECSDYFPGKVNAILDSNKIHTAKIKGSYLKSWGGPVFHMERPARKPTGTYLVPGTVATVKVPNSIVGKGYQIRVGAHSWDMKKKPRALRLHRVSAVYPIDNNEVKVANPLGGGIYIEVPYLADAGVIEVSIQNAVRSPYFSWKTFHKTTLKQWREEESKLKVPWADFQSDTFMMQVPTSWIYKLEDPVTLMKDWDKAIHISNQTMGRPHLFGKEMIYAQVDTQIRGRAFHPGYPSGNRGYDPEKDYGGYHNNHLVRGPQHAHSYEFHEQGHGYLFPKYTGDRESAVNFPYVAVLNREFNVELEEAFRRSRNISNKFVTLNNSAITWMMCSHFLDQSGMRGYERQYQAKGHAKFVDVVRLFGWKAIDDFFKSTNQDFMDGKPWGNNTNDSDAYTLRMSRVIGADLRPLMHFWGIPTQNNEASNKDIKAKKIPASSKVYDLLVTYKNLIPKNNTTFREFSLKWWGHEPSIKGFATERDHAARWKDYDEKMADQTDKVFQNILDRYFPHGRPNK